VANRPGGEPSRWRNVQGAKRPGGERTKGRNVQLPEYELTENTTTDVDFSAGRLACRIVVHEGMGSGEGSMELLINCN